ncbi:MAG: 5'-3' exonuclease H3TH domain-containing protein [Candidatus Paceibacterota bacterium]|jgi:DNA polymerase-1
MKKLLLIDASALIHRAFHALPPLIGPGGRPAGALYGLSTILIKILQESDDYIAALFDRPEPTFRKEKFDDYKIHRPKAPDELISQIKESRNLFSKFNIRTFEMPGFEADDLIGTLTKKFRQIPDLQIKILTGDLDTLQLVEDDKVVVEFLKTGVSEIKTYNEEAVIERYGLLPKQLPDFKGLAGDHSDNIPGVAGIGPKTATPLLVEYQTLENLFSRIENDPLIVKTTAIKKILGSKEQAFLSRDLGRIHCDAPLEIKDIAEVAFNGFSRSELSEYFMGFGFASLVKRIDGQNSLI